MSERAIISFASGVGFAAATRQSYGEPPLSQEAIRDYLRHSAQFYNSFFHP